MDLKLEGKIAAVTGGSVGIGKAIARTLAREGCNVAICARDQGRLEAAAKELAEPSSVMSRVMPARSIAARSTRPERSAACRPQIPARKPSAAAQPS